MAREWQPVGMGVDLCWDVADPDDPSLSAFDAGPEGFAREITRRVRSWPTWLDGSTMVPYQFGLGDATIGYAFAVRGPGPHPVRAMHSAVDYFTITVLALDLPLRGSCDPRSGRRNIDHILEFLFGQRAIEDDRLAQVAGDPPLMGTRLQVHAENTRAQCAYKRNGFEPVGPAHRLVKGELIGMWRPLDPAGWRIDPCLPEGE